MSVSSPPAAAVAPLPVSFDRKPPDAAAQAGPDGRAAAAALAAAAVLAACGGGASSAPPDAFLALDSARTDRRILQVSAATTTTQ